MGLTGSKRRPVVKRIFFAFSSIGNTLFKNLILIPKFKDIFFGGQNRRLRGWGLGVFYGQFLFHINNILTHFLIKNKFFKKEKPADKITSRRNEFIWQMVCTILP